MQTALQEAAILRTTLRAKVNPQIRWPVFVFTISWVIYFREGVFRDALNIYIFNDLRHPYQFFISRRPLMSKFLQDTASINNRIANVSALSGLARISHLDCYKLIAFETPQGVTYHERRGDWMPRWSFVAGKSRHRYRIVVRQAGKTECRTTGFRLLISMWNAPCAATNVGHGGWWRIAHVYALAHRACTCHLPRR